MESVILRPARTLWIPPAAGRLTIVPGCLPRLPFGARRLSGDTLGIFTPQANQPPATNYAALFVRNGHLVLAFDTTTQQTAIFSGVMPRNYAGGGLTVSARWMAASATSGTIGWDITFERMNAANHDLDADAFATAQTITAATVDATSGKVTVTSVAITAGAAGTDSLAAGDDFRVRIRRDVANDTAAGDAHLLAIEIKET